MDQTNPIINLLQHPDYKVATGVGRLCWWHGKDYDLTKVSVATAEMMAKDKQTLWVTHSDARLAKDAGAKVREIQANKPTAPAKTAAPAKSAAPAKTAAPAPNAATDAGYKKS